ncbi:hypothetical protein K6W16_05565 [Burkholderia dolosa]|uniref:Uncharacterized protein n=1 Tax=Burkholderia dolosa TaxID=152500 RepID=A0A892I0J9_9BURK|nr:MULTISPECIES: hypothetical protein [Burkholderia]MBR8418675.1 hypothetical protein [Burkholderia dolosa]MBY4656260.1 hypothetical protein [Burkholderia dolosa]MBY4687832.1 hypothetical protein [Burkholderia dolosa]MBY4782117.1 hypothetical protein [Burkholderia dolosa]MBY4786880.1 hypothetical protein [Burkholderia dolosa]
MESGLAGGGNPAGALAVVLGSVTRALGGAVAAVAAVAERTARSQPSPNTAMRHSSFKWNNGRFPLVYVPSRGNAARRDRGRGETGHPVSRQSIAMPRNGERE